MNEEVVRALQRVIEAIEALPEEIERIRDLEANEIVGEDDSGWQAVHDAFNSANLLRRDLNTALIDVTRAAYLVLKDSAAEGASVVRVSSRFPRHISDRRGAQFNVIVADSANVEVRDVHGKVLANIAFGARWIFHTSDGRQVSCAAFSSFDDAWDEEERLSNAML